MGKPPENRGAADRVDTDNDDNGADGVDSDRDDRARAQPPHDDRDRDDAESVTRALLLLLGVVALSGCGGGDADPAEVLSQTAANLGKIKSAESMHLKLMVDPAEGDPFGFELEGPVALCQRGRFRSSTSSTRRSRTARKRPCGLLANGTQGYVVLDGTAYQMSEEQAADLSSACEDLESGDGGLESLRVGDWVRDPEASSGDDVDTVTGELDVVAVVNDLVAIARAFGGSTLAQLDRDDAQRIADATKDSSFELETGHDDHLLRRLALDAELGFDVPDDLRRALGDAVGGSFTFELELDDPNGQVEVQTPNDARPSSELPGG